MEVRLGLNLLRVLGCFRSVESRLMWIGFILPLNVFDFLGIFLKTRMDGKKYRSNIIIVHQTSVFVK